jgi:hypothetical protein
MLLLLHLPNSACALAGMKRMQLHLQHLIYQPTLCKG